MSVKSTSFEPGRLLREARERTGMSQRHLARRAGTAQSVVSRIERGQTSPTVATWVRLLRAAGFEPRAALAPRAPAESDLPADSHRPAESHMLADVDRILRLTPEERLLEIRNLSRFETAARHP